ncbi:hypothetical protein [Oleomonas cavernae]|uniref:hypothetical protein n=1 Tax=Oleomonas cavernae TaxID=2320859 RepID=UPI0011C468DD|nr:hypothetical protein [Oleomonas cavernae]
MLVDSAIAGSSYLPDTYINPPEVGVTPPGRCVATADADPSGANYCYHHSSNFSTSLVNMLSPKTSTNPNGIQFDTYQAAAGNANLVNTLLTGVVTTLSTVTSVLAPVLSLLSSTVDSLLNTLLDLLGVDVASVDVGANLTCDDARLVN